jgi:alanine dehydrogenase
LAACPALAPAKVAILGGGVAGVNAAQMAVGMRADVTIYDINMGRLAELDMFFGSQIKTAYASSAAIANAVKKAELVIGAVLVPGAAAPKLVTRDMLKTMKRGSVLVDIAIDQGGCFETSRRRPPTPTRSTKSTGSSIIASPTCRARSPAHRPSRSTTRPCPSF